MGWQPQKHCEECLQYNMCRRKEKKKDGAWRCKEFMEIMPMPPCKPCKPQSKGELKMSNTTPDEYRIKVEQELSELVDKIANLTKFLYGNGRLKANLSTLMETMLREQLRLMEAYARVLQARLRIWGKTDEELAEERESNESQQEFLDEHSVFVNPVKTVYCPKCGKSIIVYIDGSSPNVAKCVCGNEFKFPISKITQDIFEQPVTPRVK